MLTSDRRRKEPLALWRPGDPPKPTARSSFVAAVTGAAGIPDSGPVGEDDEVVAAPAAASSPDPAPSTGLSSGFASFLSRVTSHADYRATPPPAEVIPTPVAPELASSTPAVAVEQPTDEESPSE